MSSNQSQYLVKRYYFKKIQNKLLAWCFVCQRFVQQQHQRNHVRFTRSIIDSEWLAINENLQQEH